MQLIKFKNKVLKLCVQILEKKNNINYRCEHNDNYYCRDVKRTNKFKKLKKQFI